MRSATIAYGDDTIQFRITRNPALRSKVRIHVHPDGVVEVEAPCAQSPQTIQHATQKRARWILRQLDSASATRAHSLPREYKSGETHFYLGRRYLLKVVKASTEPNSVALKGGQIRVALRHIDPLAVQRHLKNWYQSRAEDYFSRRLIEVSHQLSWLKHTPSMRLVAMKKQWGSCSPKGAIHINPWLIRAPRDCVDYVLLHELCHLREHNHSKRFYAILDRHMPEWRRTKARLDGMAELMLAT